MDAKAKVAYLVEYKGRYVGYATTDSVELVRLGDGETLIPVIPLTDHEAATAEQTARAAEWHRIAESTREWGRQHLARADAAEEKLTDLLTGLEALAGELESIGVKGGSSWSAAQRIRTLASSATGEKNTEEETKL